MNTAAALKNMSTSTAEKMAAAGQVRVQYIRELFRRRIICLLNLPPMRRGLDGQPITFWQRSLHALGYDKAIVFFLLKLVMYIQPILQDTCTKSWDQRFLDIIENFERHGICQKIATASDEDFYKCALVGFGMCT